MDPNNNHAPLPVQPLWKAELGENAFSSKIRALARPEVDGNCEIAATRRAIYPIPYPKPKTGSGSDVASANGDVINMDAKSKSPKTTDFEPQSRDQFSTARGSNLRDGSRVPRSTIDLNNNHAPLPVQPLWNAELFEDAFFSKIRHFQNSIAKNVD